MAVLFKFVLTLIRWAWKLLTFLKNVVFNMLALLVILLGITIFAAVNGNRSSQPQDGVLLFNLTGIVVDEPRNTSLLREFSNEALGLKNSEQTENSLFNVVESIRQAKDDKNITGMVLSLGQFVGANQPSLEYIGKALEEFKASGKPIIAIGRYYSQSQYYLASFANEIYLTPQGSVGLTGLATNGLYYKSMLEKLQINTHVFRVGTYKSAVEPYIRDDMSPEAKENAQRWINALWNNYLSRISANRSSEAAELMPNLDTFITRLEALDGNSSDYALKYGLVDRVMPYSEIDKLLKQKFGERENSIKSVSLYDYTPIKPASSNQQIGVIFVNGTIMNGESGSGIAGAQTIVKQLRKARFDKNVKAVVLRVNSPGGGVGASEAIRSEVAALAEAGKPIVISMSGLAASGGYWISTPGQYLIASPSTLTGSIGIFGLISTFENSLDYIGVHADGVSTSELAAASVVNKLNPNVAKVFQISVENGYRTFLDIVAKSRHKSTAQIDKVAQGQVWAGTDALKLGLVDQLGDFDDAVNKAAELAQLSKGKFELNWFTSEPTLFSMIFGGESASLQSLINQAVIGYLPTPLSKALLEVNAQQNTLQAINDPQNQYVYCLDCGYKN